MIVGGIDLSVGSTFALTNFCALYFMHVLKWPVAGAVVATLAFGALLGAVNGVLIGYFRLRAFLTTLITLIIYRALYDLLTADYATLIAAGFPDSAVWDFIGNGAWLGVPTVVYAYALVAIFGHVFLTRLRPGWHVIAIGGSRRSAYNTGIPGAAHRGAVLRRRRRAHVGGRYLLRVAAGHRRRRHRRRTRDHRPDRVRARRHQPRRRQGLGDEGDGRHADRAADRQRPDDDVAARRLQPHGAGDDPAAGGGDRHPLAEEQGPHRQQGLRQPDLPRHAAGALDRRPTAARRGR